jgi:hypothetical protein
MTCHFRPGAWPSWPTFWSLRGVVDDVSHEGVRILLRAEGVSFQRIKTWKTSRDPNYAAKKARVEHLYAIADRQVVPDDGEPEVVSAWMTSGRSTSSLTRQAVGRTRRQAQGPRPRAQAPAAGDLHPPTWGPAPVRRLRPGQGQGMGTSRRPRTGAGSWSSAATCAASTRPKSASPSSATTTPGSTGSRHSSPPCATSPSTAPTIPATKNRAA